MKFIFLPLELIQALEERGVDFPSTSSSDILGQLSAEDNQAIKVSTNIEARSPVLNKVKIEPYEYVEIIPEEYTPRIFGDINVRIILTKDEHFILCIDENADGVLSVARLVDAYSKTKELDDFLKSDLYNVFLESNNA